MKIAFSLFVFFLVTTSRVLCDLVDDGKANSKNSANKQIQFFTKAIELNSKDALAYKNRSVAKCEINDFSGAVTDCTKAIELKPDYAGAYNSRGLAKRGTGDLDGAMTDFNKAIKLDPKCIAIGNRGCLFYDKHLFSEALKDYQRLVELGLADDYDRFHIWLIRTRLGQQIAATEELEDYLKSRKTGAADDWPLNIARFLSGPLNEQDFLRSAVNSQKNVNDAQMCEAYFYAGIKRLIARDETSATGYFKKCLATDVKNFQEYQSAVAELKFLKEIK